MSDHEDKFRHLTEEQIETVYTLYLAGENITDLLLRFGIDLPANLFARHLPPRRRDDLPCPACEVPMFQRRPAKSAAKGETPPAICKRCDHRHFFPGRSRSLQTCPCRHCHTLREQARLRQEAKQREQIVAEHSLDRHSPVPYSTLDLTRKIWLMTMFEARLDWRFECLLAASEVDDDRLLTPTPKLDQILLGDLCDHHILVVDPDSPVDAFERGPTPRPHFDRVRWRVNVALEGDQRAEAQHVYRALREEFAQGAKPAWREQIETLLQALAVEEVVGFVKQRCQATDYPFTAYIKTPEVVLELLEHLPVCKIWYLADLALRNAIVHANEFKLSKAHASNSIPERMRGAYRRSVTHCWTINWDRHSSKAPRSALSKVLHKDLLGHEDFGCERKLDDYLAQLSMAASGDDVPVAIAYHCSHCGSLAVHVQAKPGELVINCKDCMARSVLPEVVLSQRNHRA